jgi:putative toxin-antitoxin system antitoxin component (TIGR02293 family)
MTSSTPAARVREPAAAYSVAHLPREEGGASIEGYLHAASSLERDCMVREGFGTGSLDTFARQFGRSGRSLALLLGVAPATYDRRVREGKPLSQDDSDRVARLIEAERAATRVFGDEAAAREWLAAPVPVLDGAVPISLLATTPGQQAVMNALRRIMAGTAA